MQRGLTLIFILVAQAAMAQAPLERLQHLSDSLIQKGLTDKQIPGIALVIVKGDSIHISARGLANVERQLPADTTTLFQLGSVGKLFTAIAVLQQVEVGTLSLTEDVNSYLSDFKVRPPGRPLTLFDLLTHTPGLNDRIIGYMARSEKDVTSLSDHLSVYFPTSFQPPGEEINYSNYGYALAGHLVERVTGLTFADYVQQRILKPLGMNSTTYVLPDDYATRDTYASGYRTRDSFEFVKSFPRHATPAGSILSTAPDMAKLLREFISPTGRILRDSSMAKLQQRQFSNHKKLMGYTLGMEEQHILGNQGIGKGGSVPGFLSAFVLFPQQQLGMFVSSNTQTDNFLEGFNRALLQAALPNRSEPFPKDEPVNLKTFAGVYRLERYNHESVEDLFALYQGKLELSVSDEGDLVAYQNGAWQHYQPVEPLLFQNKNVPEQYLAFKTDDSGRVTRLFTNINIAGFYVPGSFSPVPWYDDPEMINEYYFFILVILFTLIFVPFYRIWVLIRRGREPSYRAGRLMPNGYLYIGFVVLFFCLAQLFGGILYMARNVNEFYFGVPDPFRIVQQLTWLFPVSVGALVVATTLMWIRKPGTRVFRIYYSLICLSAVIHLLFLFRWHFIGLHI